ncbi:MAG: hypothetical protein ACE5DY_06680 [Mariprofundaceae bacterium]
MKLLIGRHAVQSILHHALVTQSSVCCGLCAGNDQHIELAVPVNNISGNHHQECLLDGKKSITILEEWDKLNINWLGVYYTLPCPPQVQSLSETLADILRENPVIKDKLQKIWHLMIRLDTKGRMEIHAFFQQKEGLIELPVVMLEEHQTISAPG